ncbi:MAG TPA: response regulator, partial [Gemmataceae bacterium]|nr:response regulator [Gemmataceae bacterium]
MTKTELIGGASSPGLPVSLSPCLVLVVDDEPIIRDTLSEFLTGEGCTVATSASGEEALELAAERQFDVALCDVQLPGMDGVEVLDRLRQISPETAVFLVTAYATVENAVEAFQRGAQDYLMKPILLDDVLVKIRRLQAFRELARENRWLRRELNRTCPTGPIVGRSAAIRRVLEMAAKVAATSSNVLLLGESGTGKEL